MNRWAALVLAAGKGTRLRSQHPKVLHRLGGEPIACAPIRQALELGAEAVVVVVGHEAERVREALEARFPGRLTFAEQREQLGTGHAARVGLASVDREIERVLVLSGDVPLLGATTLRRLLDGPERVRFLTTHLSDPTGYGRIVRDGAGRVQRIVEQRDASPAELAITEVNAGTYFVDAAFLREATGDLSSENAQREHYLTDVVEAGARDADVEAVVVEDPVEVRGINTRRELAALQAVLWARKADALMGSGVTVLDPATTRIDPNVTVGPDTVLHPGVVVRGSTRIGAGCEIDVGSVIDDSVLADEVTVAPYSVLSGAKVEAGATVGPFARLRPGSVLGAGSKVGNFVETKNCELGPGAKINHLSYVGDATVGSGANIGAGTITCNYDGVGKYQTQIGSGVFVGSNSTLVAPLRISDNAYVAAGSTLTEDVPAGSLAFGRARQSVKENRAAELRERARARAGKPSKSS